ncbi:MAG: flagellar hook-length control protein FliK [Proteobacteria bacterium]|nr:flagellar hook-length control protein FliK [Pseudomonadota bacterium]
MAVSINPIFPVIAAQGAAPEVALQPGTVIDAQVQKILANDLVRIAIANLSIEVLSEVPLQVGQTLQLAVSQTSDGLRLAVVGGQGASSDQAAGAPTATAGLMDTVTLTPDVAAAAALKADPAVAPSKPVLTALEALSVSAAAQSAATRQGSLSPLYANLLAAQGTGSLPPQLQRAVDQLLSLRPDLGPNLTGDAIKTAFQKSGLFLEASLAAGLNGSPSALPPASASASAQFPDLKAALLVLRQVLSVSTGAATAPNAPSAATVLQQAPQPAPTASGAPPLSPDFEPQEVYLPQALLTVADDMGANQTLYARLPDAGVRAAATGAALNLLQEVLQSGGEDVNRDPGARLGTGMQGGPSFRAGASNGPAGNNVFVVRTSTPPPPIRGALPSAQPVAGPAVSSAAPASEIARHLLDDTDAAIARQTLLQVASLPDRADISAPRPDQAAPRWNFEIPFATPTGTSIAQFEISRDGAGHEVEAAKRVWRARFSLDVEPAGPVHATVSLVGDKTSVRICAERPATASQLRAGASQLSQALSRAELQPGDIVIRDGTPPQPKPAPAGHFLDRAL